MAIVSAKISFDDAPLAWGIQEGVRLLNSFRSDIRLHALTLVWPGCDYSVSARNVTCSQILCEPVDETDFTSADEVTMTIVWGQQELAVTVVVPYNERIVKMTDMRTTTPKGTERRIYIRLTAKTDADARAYLGHIQDLLKQAGAKVLDEAAKAA